MNNCQYQTLVHGDAKVANFCFPNDGKEVSAVDFQYVGRGCGMKDVTYFLRSCLSGDECEKNETELLDFYFEELEGEMTVQLVDIFGKTIQTKSINANNTTIDMSKLPSGIYMLKAGSQITKIIKK